ncbi:MAG: sulfatase [Calditrichaeota bacterium]|nr:sulfatase [Calditrichota bacterium]
MKCDRRDFLKIAGKIFAIIPLAGLACGTGGKIGNKRPNILFALADDWSWPHAGIAGDRMVNTPNFDRIAREGVLCKNAFAAAPSGTASRSAILTGQWCWRLKEGANQRGTLAARFDVYPDLLENIGYHVGFTGKGWGPGNFYVGGRTRNPAGKEYNKFKTNPPTPKMSTCDYTANFKDFLKDRPRNKPFCFWYGGMEPHREYLSGSGMKARKILINVKVPGFLPEAEDIQSDLLDYALEIDWFDTNLGRMIETLQERGELDNTIIVVTSDNGMPFPRCKNNLYDYGTHVPLAVRWGERVKGNRVIEDFISLTDLAPTFLQAAGMKPTADMTGRSFLNILTSDLSGRVDPVRYKVLMARERYTFAQERGTGGYPMRAIRIRDFLYIRNFRPDRWPAGVDRNADFKDSQKSAYKVFLPNSFEPFRDVDSSPTKYYLLGYRDNPIISKYFKLCFGKRPAEELYDLVKNPDQIDNVADDEVYADVKRMLSTALMEELKASGDPRALGNGDVFDNYPAYVPPWTPDNKKTETPVKDK